MNTHDIDFDKMIREFFEFPHRIRRDTQMLTSPSHVTSYQGWTEPVPSHTTFEAQSITTTINVVCTSDMPELPSPTSTDSNSEGDTPEVGSDGVFTNGYLTSWYKKYQCLVRYKAEHSHINVTR